MNCKEFEMGLDEASPEVQAHAASCARCGTLLRERRTLAAGMRALAAVDAERSAPPVVEAALLQAFRNRAPVGAPVRSIASARLRATWTPWAWAAAAIALLTAGVWAYRALRTDAPTAGPAPVAIATPSPRSEAPALPPTLAVRAGGPRRALVPAAAPAMRPLIREEMTVYIEEIEAVTDFLPLDGAERRGPMESGQLIRVQMPQTALARFGLPVLAERADSSVKADLLVGEDGLARAIRFVR